MLTCKAPQTDGSTKIMSHNILNLLLCYVERNQKNWMDLLSTAALAYNPAHVYTLELSPFKGDLGWSAKSLIDFIFRHQLATDQSIDNVRNRLPICWKMLTLQ